MGTDESLKALWFGSNSNIRFLTQILPHLIQNSSLTRDVELTILGGAFALRAARDTFKKCSGKTSRWRLRLVQWDVKKQPQQLEMEISQAHVTLIPSDPRDSLKQGVSHNRLVDSFRGGCIPIASPMASYVELSSIALLADDFVPILNGIEANYNRIIAKHDAQRDQLLARFSPQTNQRKWEEAIAATLNTGT